jgi:tetratricopeptide (TPR) repeat protein
MAMSQAGSNAVLERLLARAGWTPENLGDRLNELAGRLRRRERIHRKSVRRWVYVESGRSVPRVPREPWPGLVCQLLHERLGEPVTVDSLGWSVTGLLRYVPADEGLDQPWDARGAVAALASVVDADAMERRHFMALTGLPLTAVAHQWLFDPARVAASVLGKRVDHALVDDLELVAEARRRMDDALGGGTLLPAVREDLRLVVAMLNNAAYTEEVGKRLHGVAAELGRLAGWLAYDSEQPAVAQRYFLAALRAAHVSGDRAIGANVLGFMSVQARESSRPGDAVTLIESALRAERELTPAVAGSLYGRLAVGAGYAGDATASQRAQDRSFELLARSVPENEPPWIYWFTEADAQGLAGESLLALGRPGEAEPHLRRAVSLLDPTFTRDRAGMLCDLATARVGTGAVERACATAGEAAAIIRRLDSPREQRLLADFRRAAAPYAGSAAVREFDAKHRDLLGAALMT